MFLLSCYRYYLCALAFSHRHAVAICLAAGAADADAAADVGMVRQQQAAPLRLPCMRGRCAAAGTARVLRGAAYGAARGKGFFCLCSVVRRGQEQGLLAFAEHSDCFRHFGYQADRLP